MEPANLTPAPGDDDRLDTLLRRSTEAPLPDNGFSARVLAALPPRPREDRDWLRAILCLLAAAAGLAVALARPGVWTDLPAASTQLVTAVDALLIPLRDPWLLTAVVAGILFLPLISSDSKSEDGLL
jgi:hypothetical protein